MGSASEYMIENAATTEIGFVCPKCGWPIAAFVRPPEHDEELQDDEQTMETIHVRCRHKSCSAEWTIDMYAAWPEAEVTVRESLKTLVRSRTLGDGWDDEPPPEPGAYGIFLGALDELRIMVRQMSNQDGASTANRMLFTHLYSMTEAYLSDVVTGFCMKDENVQQRLIGHVDALRGKKVSLEDVLTQPTIVVDHIRAHLAKTSFHNLEAVDKLTQATIGHSIFPEKKHDRELLETSVNKRHDCVHRNGLTHGGQLHDDILPDYILRLASLFEAMAQDLEYRLGDLQVERWFTDLGEEVVLDE